jgi:hypothetical protein
MLKARVLSTLEKILQSFGPLNAYYFPTPKNLKSEV